MGGVGRAVADDHAVAVALCILLDDDGVGAFGQRRAGENADGLAAADVATITPARRRFANHVERCRKPHDIRGAHGIAVHGRGVERRLGEFGGDIGGQHAARRVIEGHGLGRRRQHAVEDACKGFGDGEEGHGLFRPRERGVNTRRRV